MTFLDDVTDLDKVYAPVQGEGTQRGRTPQDIPPGYVRWEEHYEAWANYSTQHHGQNDKVIAERGGFGYRELQRYLGRNPTTWRPRDLERYKDFELAPEDRPETPLSQPEDAVTDVSHIRNIFMQDTPICEDTIGIPEGAFEFDPTSQPNCNRCFAKLVSWLDWWAQNGKND